MEVWLRSWGNNLHMHISIFPSRNFLPRQHLRENTRKRTVRAQKLRIRPDVFSLRTRNPLDGLLLAVLSTRIKHSKRNRRRQLSRRRRLSARTLQLARRNLYVNRPDLVRARVCGEGGHRVEVLQPCHVCDYGDAGCLESVGQRGREGAEGAEGARERQRGGGCSCSCGCSCWCSYGVGGVVACGVSQVRRYQTGVMQRGK
jgi:hypothetical protein